MKIPNLNRPLILQDLVRNADGAGGFTEIWHPLGTLWAAVRATGGREGEADHAKLSQVSYIMTVRAAPYGAASRPKPEQRLVDGDRVFRILAVSELESSAQYLSLRVVEEVAS